MSGTLIIISAASGTGKTTLVSALCQELDNIKVSISCTTRPKRPGEQDGVDYYFVDKKKFQAMIEAGEFLEHEIVFDNHYGTPRRYVEEQLAAGIDIILEIDWQGARDIRTLMPGQVMSIFILPPTFATLEQRLRGRGKDSDSVIQRRVGEALEEISHCTEFDYLVINDDLQRALGELKQIISQRRLGNPPKKQELSTFVQQLIAEGRHFQ